jgi:mRNA interferase RelE/StbE
LSEWRVELTRRAERDLRRLDPQVRRRVVAALDGLRSEPATGDVRKLRGSGDQWRLRVGAWRIRFRRDRDRGLVEVVRILPRGRAYRD